MEATMQEQIEGIEMFHSPTKGRGLRVTKPFKVGELIFSSPAYSYILNVELRGEYCEFCVAKKQDLKNCVKCKKAFYCNVTCQKGNWAMHKLECSAMVKYGPKWCPYRSVRLVARILATKKAQKERSASEKLILMEELHSNEEKKWIHKAEIANLHHFYSKHLDFPDHHDLLSIFSQVHCNSFDLHDEELSPCTGIVVYADVSLINHSCVPSVIVTNKGTAAEIRALQDMKPGDEMLISYIDLMYPTEDRNDQLRKKYNFTCDCQECQTKSKDKAKLKVRQRSDPIGQDVISNMVSVAKKAIELLELAIESKERTPSELLDMYKQSLDKMGTVFDDSNVYMLFVMKLAWLACRRMGDLNGAIRYGEKITQPLSELYPPFSPNVYTLYIGLFNLYMGVDNPFMAMGCLEKAIPIVEVHCGKDHPYLKKLQKDFEMLRQLCTLLR